MVTLRAGLEFAILQNGEVDAADPHARVVDADAALNGTWIVGVRQMPGLVALHHVHARTG